MNSTDQGESLADGKYPHPQLNLSITPLNK